jgi:hypothetical protein
MDVQWERSHALTLALGRLHNLTDHWGGVVVGVLAILAVLVWMAGSQDILGLLIGYEKRVIVFLIIVAIAAKMFL